MDSTADRIIDQARKLIMVRGYNGFSYADIAAAIGIRKASIHHHFPAKSDLVKAVVDQSRDSIAAQIKHAGEQGVDARTQLRGYVDYWDRCITDDSAPFCIAAMLSAERPSLPEKVAAAVTGHFADLTDWLTAVLEAGARQGSVTLVGSPAEEADAFVSAVYGAMLSARAFAEPRRFAVIAETLLSRIVALH